MSILKHFIPEGKHKIVLACMIGSCMVSVSPLQADAANIPEQKMAAVFDADYYADRYADLKDAFGYDKDALYDHFLTYGMKEGRNASPDFNVQNYKAMYKDLQNAFGDDISQYYEHYVTYGINEGRSSGIDDQNISTDHTSSEIVQAPVTVEETNKVGVDDVAFLVEDGVSTSYITQIKEYLKLVPNSYIEKFVMKEWKIQVTVDPINEQYAGWISPAEKKIYIWKGQTETIVHEMGHFVDYIVFSYKSSSDEFQEIKNLYYPDVEAFFKSIYGKWVTSDYISYYRDSDREFFAFCFDYTYNVRSQFDEKFTQAFDYIKSLS